MRKSLISGLMIAGALVVGLNFRTVGLAQSATAPGFSTGSGPDANSAACPVKWQALRTALVSADTDDTSGLNNHYWAVVVNREGVVCAVAYSGASRDAQWLLSRQIAAAKAFTANGLSLDGHPLSTAQLYPWVQPGAPGNPLFGLAGGNPVSPDDAYKGPYNQFGTKDDPMVNKRVGGTITFGGGLGLYHGAEAIGGLGLSGDTACADHSTAWRVRDILNLEPTPLADKITLGDMDHPHCPNDADTQGAN